MRIQRLAPIIIGGLLLTGCVTEQTGIRPAPSTSSGPSGGPVAPIGTPTILADGLTAPWSILRLGDADSTLISERDSGVIEELTAGGSLRRAGTVAGVVHDGEGGLLGLEALREGSTTWVYAYLTTASDNRIVRMPLDGHAGSYALGPPETILRGLAKAGNHNGGRIRFGPDGMLYATVGDAGVPDRAQDRSSLNGKILRMTATGGVPKDNPVAGSLIWSMGHRNPQGLTWDAQGQLWAAEFGQNTWDEFNRITAGANYGWPIVEGMSSEPGDKGFSNPEYQWPTSEASPSGLTFVDGTFFLAALRGQRIWGITVGTEVVATPYFASAYGRIRDAAPGPHGTLWILTNNTDGRGEPRDGDDKLLQVTLTRAGD